VAVLAEAPPSPDDHPCKPKGDPPNICAVWNSETCAWEGESYLDACQNIVCEKPDPLYDGCCDGTVFSTSKLKCCHRKLVDPIVVEKAYRQCLADAQSVYDKECKSINKELSDTLEGIDDAFALLYEIIEFERDHTCYPSCGQGSNPDPIDQLQRIACERLCDVSYGYAAARLEIAELALELAAIENAASKTLGARAAKWDADAGCRWEYGANCGNL
jgi:hypothetical protein